LLFPTTLRDQDFELHLMKIHTVKVQKELREGAEHLALPDGTIGIPEKGQDFRQGPKIRKPEMPELLENRQVDP